jgi:hypothetical protein
MSICDTDPSKSAIVAVPLANTSRPRDREWTHGVRVKTPGPHRTASSRRIVIVVPPVDDLDLVGPLQAFNSVNVGLKACIRPVIGNNATRLTPT